MRRRLEETVAAMIERYRREIVDYAVLDRELLENDVAGVSRDNLVCLLDYLERGDRITEDELRAFRAGAARRVHQGVSLDSLLHAYRLWGQTVWDTVLACADRGEPDEREAALAVAGVLISHLNLVSTTIAKAYLDETEGVWSQQEVVGRALLESLISGAGASAEVVEGARRAGVELGDAYIVVSVAPDGSHPGARTALRTALAEMGSILPHSLVGLRHSEAVALCPVSSAGEAHALHERCDRLASALAASGLYVGVGGWRAGLQGIRAGYAEAEQALRIARSRGALGEAVVFDDVAVDHTLSNDRRTRALLLDTLKPLSDYDAKHRGGLVETLASYAGCGFNLTKAARSLSVHPNTVVYRLRRIHELTGRDPHDTTDLLTLCLALRLQAMEPGDQSRVSRLPIT
jgi:hypothetical protein